MSGIINNADAVVPAPSAGFVGRLTKAADVVEPLLPSDATLVHWSLYAWLLCLLCLSPALCRIVTLRPRSLDPIWGLVALLAMNRLSFLAKISPEVSHATALALALGMSALSTWYQRWDKANSV